MDVESGPFSSPSAITEPDHESAGFFVHKDGVTYGPESAGNLRLLCAEGWLQRVDLIWREGAPEWLDAGVVFASSFGDALSLEETSQPGSSSDGDEVDFQYGGAVRISTDMPWPWRAVAIAVGAHIIILLLAVEFLNLFPVHFTAYVSPTTKEPPLEVMMVPEEAPASPPLPAPAPPLPDPMPPEPTAPPPPTLQPPPPPAPAEMPLPSLAPPPLPVDPVVPENVATEPVAPAIPRPEHHKIAKVQARENPPPVVSRETPPPSDDTGQPQYLADPRPIYPFAARQRHQQGTVLLLVTLDGAGNPVSVSIEQSSGYGVLDQAARKKVASDWRFKPGQGSTVHVPVEFHLDE